MQNINYQNNLRDFKATCSEAEIHENEHCYFKHVNMFGEQTLIFWKGNGRMSTRKGHVAGIKPSKGHETLYHYEKLYSL